jgi:hypothetical protein
MNKKFYFIGLLSAMTIMSNAQNTFPTAVNTTVGLGTGSTALPTSTTLRLKVTSGTSGVSGINLTNVTSATTTSSSNGKNLTVDATGNVILTPDVSLYSTDGTIIGSRNISLSGNSLTITPLASNSQFFVNGTSGNVGLGTIAPSVRLDVSGDIQVFKGNFTNS